MPRALQIQNGDHVVEPAHGEGSDEERDREEPEGLPEPGARSGGRNRRERRVGGPARAGGAAFHEERRGGDEDARHQDPVGEHVERGKCHVARSDLERDQIVPEAAHQGNRHEEEDHDRAVHRDERDVELGLHETAFHAHGKNPREEVPLRRWPGELEPDEPGEERPQYTHEAAGEVVLNPDDFVVGAEDVAAQEALLNRGLELDVAGHFRLSSSQRSNSPSETTCRKPRIW